MSGGGGVAPGGAVGGDSPSLVLREVTVTYGATVAVDHVSLSVNRGETVAVVGPSGSGKSTLLRAVAGLEPLAAGEILAGGKSLVGAATHERDLGLMFQEHALFPHLDVSGNVAFGLRMKGWSNERRRARVGELLELVGLTGLGGRRIDQLSGGEAQRVALARALAPAPSLLMLDEPFGSLDRLLREELTAEVRRLLVELGQTALHVTHDQVEAFAVADRVAVLADGRLQQIGRPAELWRAPRSAFVAEFLGHVNIWPVEIDHDGGVTVGGQLITAQSELRPGAASIVVPVDVVRPDPGGPLRVVVEEVVFREGRYRVRGSLPAAEDDARGGESVSFDSRSAPAIADLVTVAVDIGGVHRLE